MLVKMIRADDGHAVDAHPDMVADYMTGGYRVIDDGLQAKDEAETKAPPTVRRGRKPKVQS